MIIYVTVLSSKVPNTFWLELTENLNPLSHFEWPNISIHHVEVLYPVYGSPVKYFVSSCIDVVLNRSNLLLVMINRLVSFFLKSKLIISISLCFRCDSKFWWLLHTCVCEKLIYVPYDECKLNLIDVLIVFHVIIMILHFFNLTTLTSTEWKKIKRILYHVSNL